jgi:hypothetical protein
MSLKESVKRRAPPWFTALYSYLCWNLFIQRRWRRMGVTAVFTEHYKNNSWGVEETRSGLGSTVYSTEAIRAALPQLITEFQIRTMLDIPCGDLNWMRLLDLPVTYIGADIVEEIVAHNQRRYSSQTRSFLRIDLITDPLPKVDLILCRDCLFHFSFQHIRQALTNIKRSGGAFLLTTTNPLLERNHDIVTGGWRRLNLQGPPFSLPKPVMLIGEKSPYPADDRHLGLWRISDIPPITSPIARMVQPR